MAFYYSYSFHHQHKLLLCRIDCTDGFKTSELTNNCNYTTQKKKKIFVPIVFLPLSISNSYLQHFCNFTFLTVFNRSGSSTHAYKFYKNLFNFEPILLELTHTSPENLVLIGFNFNPILSGEKSSGEILVGLKGLLGLTLH